VSKVYAIMIKKQEEHIKRMGIIGSIICYGMSSYLLGGFGQEGELFEPVIITKDPQEIIVYKKSGGDGGPIVASKSGKKYYFPWCSGINRIKKENRIFFEDEAAAEARGLTLSKTCD